MKYIIYNSIKKLKIFNSLLDRIESRMDILYPGNKERVIKNTLIEFLKLFLNCIVVFIAFIIYGKINVIYIFVATSVLFVVARNNVYSKFDKLEIRLLKQFEKYIQDVRFLFKYDGMIDEALQEALQAADEEMCLQGSIICECLSDNGEEIVYNEIAPNHFLLTFYALCESVKLYGDKVVDGKSSFLTNLSFLMDDINTEILKREKISSLFMGLNGVTIIPLFAIKPITCWGISNISGLESYYDGIKGKMSIIIITVITVFIINIITKLRYPLEYDNHKSKLVEKVLSFQLVDNILMRFISKKYKHYYDMDSFLKSIVYKYNIKEFIVYRMICGTSAFVISSIIFLNVGLYRKNSVGLVITFVLIVLSSVIAYYYEFVMLFVREKLLKMNREEEVVRFQSVIMILKNIDRISIENILDWMEQFAVVFKNTIEEISDSLIYKGNEIFREIKEKNNFLPFERLLDCFGACDRIGISRAFSDIESDRKYYIEKHRQDNEIIINNKALIAKFIAFIPICLVIIFILVVPFVYQGLQELSSFDLI